MDAFIVKKITNKNGLAFQGYIPETYLLSLLRRGQYGIGLMTREGHAAGALWAELKDGLMRIQSIYIDKTVQGKGGGTLLVRAAQALAHRLGAQGVTVQIPAPEFERMVSYFAARGFAGPEAGNTILTIDLEKANNRSFLDAHPDMGGIWPMEQLSKDVMATYFAKLGKEIPEKMDIRAVEEPIFPEGTLALVKDGAVQAFVIMTRPGNQEYYIHALYAGRYALRQMPALLARALRATLRESGGKGRLVVSAGSAAGMKIALHILRDNPDCYTTQTMQIMVADAGGGTGQDNEKEADLLNIEEMNSNMDILAPKLMQLLETLEELGLEGDLVMSAEGLPYLLCRQPGQAEMVFSYVPLSGDEASAFLLTAMCMLPAPDLGLARRQMLCSQFNYSSTGVFLADDAALEVLHVRATLPEAEQSLTQAQIRLFVQLFTLGMEEVQGQIKTAREQ